MKKKQNDLIKEAAGLCAEVGDTFFHTILHRSSKFTDLTLSQLNVLKLLDMKEKSKMKEIAEKLSIAPSGATYIINTLIKEDLVERFRTTEDRRVVEVKINERGKHLIEELRNIKRDLWTNILEDTEEEKIQELFRAIRIVHSIVLKLREKEELFK